MRYLGYRSWISRQQATVLDVCALMLLANPSRADKGPSSPQTLGRTYAQTLGVFVGRAVPVVGWVIAAKDVMMISIRSVSRYNALVKPEDKVF
ncbi:hypothetical protein CFB52_004545 [Burkholderia sp. AU18528]|nr:hypothetical protein CFB52_004545 [Burkholderia sp. AU18528]